MGVWASGLYSGDFALDLMAVVKAVARLPFDGEKLVDLLCETEPKASSNSDDEDHTTFWLVVADQFAKMGIISARARAMALQIIDGGRDTAMLARLGAGSLDLTKRQKMLDNLRRSLKATPKPAKPRSVLQKPQPFLMDVGDVFVYPTSLGRCRQYCPPTVRVVPPWEQDGWSAALIVSAERAFGFLAWYRPLTLASPLSEKPDLARLRSGPVWELKAPGTCSKADLTRLKFDRIGTFRVDQEKLSLAFPALPPGTHAAVTARSIDRELNVGVPVHETFISEAAVRQSAYGDIKLPDLIREAMERYEKHRALYEKVSASVRRRDPRLGKLDDILS